jgi:hypothetical protein
MESTYNTIGDLQHRNDLNLVANSQDVEQCYYHLHMSPKENTILFVKILEGEYVEVYEAEGMPYNHKQITRIK